MQRKAKDRSGRVSAEMLQLHKEWSQMTSAVMKVDWNEEKYSIERQS